MSVTIRRIDLANDREVEAAQRLAQRLCELATFADVLAHGGVRDVNGLRDVYVTIKAATLYEPVSEETSP